MNAPQFLLLFKKFSTQRKENTLIIPLIKLKKLDFPFFSETLLAGLLNMISICFQSVICFQGVYLLQLSSLSNADGARFFIPFRISKGTTEILRIENKNIF